MTLKVGCILKMIRSKNTKVFWNKIKMKIQKYLIWFGHRITTLQVLNFFLSSVEPFLLGPYQSHISKYYFLTKIDYRFLKLLRRLRRLIYRSGFLVACSMLNILNMWNSAKVSPYLISCNLIKIALWKIIFIKEFESMILHV